MVIVRVPHPGLCLHVPMAFSLCVSLSRCQISLFFFFLSGHTRHPIRAHSNPGWLHFSFTSTKTQIRLHSQVSGGEGLGLQYIFWGDIFSLLQEVRLLERSSTPVGSIWNSPGGDRASNHIVFWDGSLRRWVVIKLGCWQVSLLS